MKPVRPDLGRVFKRPAFTLIELLVVIAIIAVLAAMLLPSFSRAKAQTKRIACVNNLKEMGVASKAWAMDHRDRLPMTVEVSEGGPPESVFAYGGLQIRAEFLYQVWAVMSNELRNPKLLICPSDERLPHENFNFQPEDDSTAASTSFNNKEVSYFLGVDAVETKPQTLLAGDRNIYNMPSAGLPASFPNSGYGNPSNTSVAMGTYIRTNEPTPCWTDKMHRKNGNVLLTDGSAHEFNTPQFRGQCYCTGDNTFRRYGAGEVAPNVLAFP